MKAHRSLAASAAALALAAGAALAVTEAPPRERDCARWVDASWPRRALEPEAAASGAPASVFAERLPNVDAIGRRAASLEMLLCEQLNVKDKLDWLIRRMR